MEGLLAFFADLILFTAGIFVALLWIAIFVAIVIEVIDHFDEKKAARLEEEL